MDAVYLLTSLITLLGVIVGLILTCHIERRSLEARRRGAKLGSREPLPPAVG